MKITDLFPKKDKRTALEKEIDDVLAIMATYRPDSDEYAKMATNLEVLRKAEVNKPKPFITPDIVVAGALQLAAVLLVLNHERADVITSKAFNWVKWR